MALDLSVNLGIHEFTGMGVDIDAKITRFRINTIRGGFNTVKHHKFVIGLMAGNCLIIALVHELVDLIGVFNNLSNLIKISLDDLTRKRIKV